MYNLGKRTNKLLTMRDIHTIYVRGAELVQGGHLGGSSGVVVYNLGEVGVQSGEEIGVISSTLRQLHFPLSSI